MALTSFTSPGPKNGGRSTYFDANQLAASGPGIQYSYTKGRLEGISYPTKPEVEYTYGLSTAPVGEKGRLLSVRDETGEQRYFYGGMGEITRIERTVDFPDSTPMSSGN